MMCLFDKKENNPRHNLKLFMCLVRHTHKSCMIISFCGHKRKASIWGNVNHQNAPKYILFIQAQSFSLFQQLPRQCIERRNRSRH